MNPLDPDRRGFLRSAAATLATAQVGMFMLPSRFRGSVETPTASPSAGASRQLAAIGDAAEWLNTPRLTPSSLQGKVVLVDFWTYTCINWLRTLPYVRAWAKKYRDTQVLIGVHTPEFPFEHNLDNVRRAVRQMAIEYPVVIDNDYAIWRAFANQYWPALYFVDGRGRVRDQHFGEGKYEESEMIIQRLLREAGASGVRDGLVSVEASGIEAAADWANLRSPENYLGYARTENFASPGGAERDRRRDYAAPTRLSMNQWALSGTWTIGKQVAVLAQPNGRIACRFHARDVHLVMGPSRPEAAIRFRVTIDGQPPGPARGGDVGEGGDGSVVEQRLYQLIRQPKPISDRRFEIEFLDAGVEAFAFTFG